MFCINRKGNRPPGLREKAFVTRWVKAIMMNQQSNWDFGISLLSFFLSHFCESESIHREIISWKIGRASSLVVVATLLVVTYTCYSTMDSVVELSHRPQVELARKAVNTHMASSTYSLRLPSVGCSWWLLLLQWMCDSEPGVASATAKTGIWDNYLTLIVFFLTQSCNSFFVFLHSNGSSSINCERWWWGGSSTPLSIIREKASRGNCWPINTTTDNRSSFSYLYYSSTSIGQ